MIIEDWIKAHTADLNGRVVVMTGAAGGLGSKLSRYLVQLNAKLIMLDRDVAKMQALRDELLKEFPQAVIEMMPTDLNHLAEVHDTAQVLLKRRIDYLILNAGVYNVPLLSSELGYNNVFQINFISQYYLTKALMPALERTKGKVVATASIAYKYATFDENDLDYTKHAKNQRVYGNSKRWLMFALSGLFQKPGNVRLALVHPGVTLTPMTSHYPKGWNWLVKWTMKIMFPKPEVAALNLLWGVFKDIYPDQWIGPKQAQVWGEPTVQSFQPGTEEERRSIFEMAEKIYEVAENFVKIS